MEGKTIASTKLYTIEVTEYSDGSCETKRTSKGFNVLEIIGLLESTKQDVHDQIKGRSNTTVIIN